MDLNILGYPWDQIQRAQRGGRLADAVDTSKPPAPDPVTQADRDLLAKHGADGLKTAGFFGTLDRLTRAGIIERS